MVCPECGREFDPGDPRTFDRSLRSRSQRIDRWGLIVCSAEGPASLFFAGLCWLIATITLGHAPRPSIDDPGKIRFLHVPLLLWYISMIASLALAPGVVILGAGVWFAREPAPDRRSSRRLVLICFLLGAASLAVILLWGTRSTLFQWLMD